MIYLGVNIKMLIVIKKLVYSVKRINSIWNFR